MLSSAIAKAFRRAIQSSQSQSSLNITSTFETSLLLNLALLASKQLMPGGKRDQEEMERAGRANDSLRKPTERWHPFYGCRRNLNS
jgi:hypothetical protein